MRIKIYFMALNVFCNSIIESIFGKKIETFELEHFFQFSNIFFVISSTTSLHTYYSLIELSPNRNKNDLDVCISLIFHGTVGNVLL